MSNETAPAPDTPAPVKDAPAPFSGVVESDNDTRPSDFILRSGDGMDFHVRKDMLLATSDFFQGMFSVPRGSGDPDELSRDGKPVVSLPESARVLYGVLWLAYPRQSWVSLSKPKALGDKDIDGIAGVHATANKYQFLVAERLAKEMLESPVLLDAYPHRLFAIARLRGLPALARKAAIHTLKSPVSPTQLTFPEMRLLTWETAQELYDFHRRCGPVVSDLARKAASTQIIGSQAYNDETRKHYIWWTGFEENIHSAQCGPSKDGVRPSWFGLDLDQFAPAAWFRNHVEQLVDRLAISPAAATVQTKVVEVSPTVRTQIEACDACSKHADRDLEHFARQLAKRVEASNADLGKSRDYFLRLLYTHQ
jgi:hypothetical protein